MHLNDKIKSYSPLFMNRKVLFLLITLCCYLLHGTNHAQKIADNFGNVTQADLEMKVCDIDTSAPAFVVYDQGETDFIPGERNFDVLYTRTMRIKILRKAGIRYSEMIIPLYVDYRGEVLKDELTELHAITYNLINGKIIKTTLDPKTVFEQKIRDYLTIKLIAFPDVHEGSVLEIRYIIKSPFKFRLNDWVFQREIPVVYSECILKYTPFYLYTYLLKNANKFDEYQEYQVEGLAKEFYNTTYKEGACRFVMKNVPAFTETEFVSSNDDYLITLHFQLNKVTNTREVSEDICSTWDELVKLLKEEDDFGKYLHTSQSTAKQILNDSRITGLPPAERFNAIISWVKTNLSWNEHYRIYTENKVREVLKRKSGSSSEINLLLCGMLNAADIEACPVLISTRGNARVIKDYPFIDFFNYVMVAAKIGDKWVLTDGTEPLCENNSFPPRCINGQGLMVKNDKLLWVDVSSGSYSSYKYHVRLRFTPGLDSLEARSSIEAKGYLALELRKSMGDDPSKVIKYFSETGVETGDSLSVSNAGADSVMKPYIIRLKGKIPVEITDKMLVVEPFCNMQIKKNPLDKAVRKYPIDMIYPYNKTFFTELVIPVGYRIRQLPESITREHDQMVFSYTSLLSEDKILIHAFYSFKSAVYTPDEYMKLQQFFADIVKKLNEKIYLEKIN